MDNGLIFPYRLKNDHAEPSNAKRPNLDSLRGRRGSARPELVVGKQWGDAGRQPNPGDG